MLCRMLKETAGAAAVEMALVAPLLIAIAFGAMELGYYFYSEHVVIKSVRDGARFASREGFSDYSCSDNSIDSSVVTDTQRVTRTNQVDDGGQARLPNWTDDSTVSVTMTCDTSGTYGSFYDGLGGVPVVTVTATVPYTSLFGILGFKTTGFKLQATSQSPVMGI
jgi:Flp pilus assembly protein TadG